MNSGAAMSWRSFMTEPAVYIAPERLFGALGGEIPAELCARLQSCERLHERLSVLIAERGGLPAPVEPDGLDPQDQAIALVEPGQLAAIVERAGAIFWSDAMANAVRGRHVAALQASLGEDLCRFAIKHRDLAGPETALEPFETLRGRIIADGWRCYAGWCDALPFAVGARARLRIPPGEEFDLPAAAPFSETGPAIIRLAAA